MSNRKTTAPLTDPLRRAIIESKLPLLTLEQATGVTRQSIMYFVRGKRSLRLDKADKLAEFFALRLTRPRNVRRRT